MPSPYYSSLRQGIKLLSYCTEVSHCTGHFHTWVNGPRGKRNTVKPAQAITCIENLGGYLTKCCYKLNVSETCI